MYRRPKFLEVLLEIRRQMALEADYDVDLFTEMARSGVRSHSGSKRVLGPDAQTNRSRKTKARELSRSHNR